MHRQELLPLRLNCREDRTRSRKYRMARTEWQHWLPRNKFQFLFWRHDCPETPKFCPKPLKLLCKVRQRIPRKQIEMEVVMATEWRCRRCCDYCGVHSATGLGLAFLGLGLGFGLGFGSGLGLGSGPCSASFLCSNSRRLKPTVNSSIEINKQAKV